ncbi:MAG TPA: bacteriohemerythrin [Syntrophales bacterium]|nr:bacteriohemerythrin [Syntrophales bacterium]
MALITWTDALSVNIKEIDNQHQRLFDLMNKLHEAMKIGKGNDVLGGILGDLVKYTVVHFSSEETYLKKYDYPEYVQHKKIHDDLTRKAKALKASFDQGKQTVSIEVLTFLKDWLNNHILKTDKRYSSFLNGKGMH